MVALEEALIATWLVASDMTMKRPPAIVTEVEEMASLTKRVRVVTPNTSLVSLAEVPDLAGPTASGGSSGDQAMMAATSGVRPAGKPSLEALACAARVEASATATSLGEPNRKGSQPPVATKTGRWTKREDLVLRQTVRRFEGAPLDWKQIAQAAFDGARSDAQCHERWEKVLKLGLVKGPWTPEEDEIVRKAVDEYLHVAVGNAEAVNWSEVAKLLSGRLTKQVRERWQNHLNPSLVKSPWTEEEDCLLVALQACLGNRWNEIARAFSGRSENAIKNRWNSKQRRSLLLDQTCAKTIATVCTTVDFHKALVKASGNDPEISEAASILVNKVSNCVCVV